MERGASCAIFLGLVVVVSGFCMGPVEARAQAAPAPFHILVREDVDGSLRDVFSPPHPEDPQLIRIEDARWLQLVFSDYNLGASSTLTIENLKDGDTQTFNQQNLDAYLGSTAMFSTNALRISVRVAENEVERVFYEIGHIVVGEPARPRLQGNLCEGDDRTPSSDPRVGRIMPQGCSCWIIGENTFLTAGHCFDGATSPQMLQFNVPASTTDGTPQNPSGADQYRITAMAVSKMGLGDDWAVFRVATNDASGKLPRQVQGGAFGLSNTLVPADVRVLGYGLDEGTASQTQQVASGALTDAGTPLALEYFVDTREGSSGSPVISVTEGVAIGLHTTSACVAPFFGNLGTNFRNETFWTTIQQWLANE